MADYISILHNSFVARMLSPQNSRELEFIHSYSLLKQKIIRFFASLFIVSHIFYAGLHSHSFCEPDNLPLTGGKNSWLFNAIGGKIVFLVMAEFLRLYPRNKRLGAGPAKKQKVCQNGSLRIYNI